MWKGLATLVVILSVAQLAMLATGQAPKKPVHDREDRSQTTDRNASPAESAAPVATQNGSSQRLKSGGTINPSDHQEVAINVSNPAPVSEWTWHDKIAWISGLVLTGFLIWGVIVAAGTLQAIKQQVNEMKGQTKAAEDNTVAAKKAAEAALLQAEHTETTERAWLIVSFVSMKDKELKDGEIADCRWAIKNVGATPAILLETKTRFQVFRLYDGMPDDPVKQLPAIPDYGNSIPINERLLAPQDSMGYFTKWERYIDGQFSEFMFPAKDNEIWMVVAYGYVKYRDTFGRERESRSCDFALVGRDGKIIVEFRPHPKAPAAYNRCT